MKEAKRGTVGMLLLAAVSLDVWIVMIFVNIMAWIPGLVAMAIMGIVDYARKRAKQKLTFGPNLVLGMITFVVVGMGVNLPLWQFILCTPLMPLGYATAMDTYAHMNNL